MRQQQNNCRDLLTIIATLRSRGITVGECFLEMQKAGRLGRAARQLTQKDEKNIPELEARMHSRLASVASMRGSRSFLGLERPASAILKNIDDEVDALDEVGDAINLPVHNLFDRCGIWLSQIVGSIWMVIAYWIGMFAWLGLGGYYEWSNNWQLWLNTVTAVFLTLTTTMLTTIRKSHADYLDKCMDAILKYDCLVEYQARKLTKRLEENPDEDIGWSEHNWGPRAIDWYAELIGSGYGVCVSSCVFIAWLGIGDVMSWNDNWWLIIGTYTGLIGFIDGFVLRNCYYREDVKIKIEIDKLVEQDQAVFARMGLKGRVQTDYFEPTLMSKVSTFTGYLCSTPHAVAGSIIVSVGLIAAASGMLWSESAQLMVNSPTMIVEGYLLIVLIDAHNVASVERRVIMHDILVRRLQMLVILRRVQASEQDGVQSVKPDASSLSTDKPMDEDSGIQEDFDAAPSAGRRGSRVVSFAGTNKPQKTNDSFATVRAMSRPFALEPSVAEESELELADTQQSIDKGAQI